MTSQERIRRARPEESEALRELAHRSKGYWRYDDAFMAAAAGLWHMTPQDVATQETWVLELDGRVAGWHRVRLNGTRAELEDLWLEPELIGRGHGRTLFQHAAAVATQAGADVLEWDADPNAEPFYLAMGGRTVGATPSGIGGGREIPRMRLGLLRQS